MDASTGATDIEKGESMMPPIKRITGEVRVTVDGEEVQNVISADARSGEVLARWDGISNPHPNTRAMIRFLGSPKFGESSQVLWDLAITGDAVDIRVGDIRLEHYSA
jgi:hypothetical protein